MPEYKEEDYLMISGLQHYVFCKRQWALIHIENLWAENFRTADGAVFHKNAHEGGDESRGDLFITRGMPVFSATLGITGECDVVEFHRRETGVPINGKSGLWNPYPVEYKRGQPNPRSGDKMQLCAQIMCLEEMLCCEIPEGALYYGEYRHRQTVTTDAELRENVAKYLEQMHELMKRGHTPGVKRTKSCNACSLKDLCVPKLLKNKSVRDYINRYAEEE